MCKKLIFIFMSMLVLVCVSHAYAETVTIKKSLLEKILQRQEALEKKIELLEQMPKKRNVKSVVSSTDNKYLKEDVEDISSRLDAIETKSILDRISISGDFRTRMDSYDYNRYVDPLTGQRSEQNVDEIWSNRLRLNLKGEITDNLIFHGRLSCFKLWGDSNFSTSATDMTNPSVPDAEGDIHLERAYIDYFVPGTSFSFTFGRLPTNEGPPNELKDNTSRKSTWPKLMIDGESDGIIANLSLEKWTGLKGSIFRLAYAKIFQNCSKYTGIDLDDSRAAVAAFEMEIPGVKDSMVWISYSKLFGIPALTQSSIPASFPFEVESTPEDAGELELYNFHLQFNNIQNKGLDWFGSFAYADFSPGSQGTVFSNPAGYQVGLFSDNLSGNLGEKRDGQAFYTGLKYRLPINALKNPSIGVEYNHGSKYWTGLLSSGSGDLINKLGVNGDAYELYYIQPIDKKYMFCRVGIVYMDYDHYNPMLVYGSQQESDMSITNMYFLVDVKF